MKHLACIALLPIVLAGCGQKMPDPLLAAGEQAIVGSYSLDNVLLRPGTVVVLRDSVFGGIIGDTPEQAAKKGILTLAGAALLQRNDCRMQIAADHTFVISNLPAADMSGILSLRGRWTLTVYHFSETYGYRISMKERSGGNRCADAQASPAVWPHSPFLPRARWPAAAPTTRSDSGIRSSTRKPSSSPSIRLGFYAWGSPSTAMPSSPAAWMAP